LSYRQEGRLFSESDYRRLRVRDCSLTRRACCDIPPMSTGLHIDGSLAQVQPVETEAVREEQLRTLL